MLFKRRSLAAGLLAGTALLSGSAQNGFAADGLDAVAEQLGLPVGRTTLYYNSATDTAVKEQCKRDAASIACETHILSNATLLGYRQTDIYSLNESNRLSMQTTVQPAQRWTPDVFDYTFMPVKKGARPLTRNADSPLAHVAGDGSGRVIQNNVGEIRLIGPEAVSLRSSIPVNERRDLTITLEFDRSAGTVAAQATMRATWNGLTVSGDGAKASRPFDYNPTSLDGDFFSGYARRAQPGGAPSYSPDR